MKRDGGEFDARTGATVTSRAVTRLANEISCTYMIHRAEILARIGGKGEKK